MSIKLMNENDNIFGLFQHQHKTLDPYNSEQYYLREIQMEGLKLNRVVGVGR